MSIDVNVSIKLSWEELRELSPEQCEAVMRGIAKVVSANPYEHDNELLEQRAKVFVERMSE